MPLSLVEQWTLVVCGVMAHADGVMDGEECDRLMALIEDHVDGDEYSDWLATISDAKKLDEMLAALDPPQEASHREILEQAWTLAIVDGERSPHELAALVRIAHRLGVEPVQLDYWREAWTTGQESIAEAIACAVAHVLGGDAAPSTEDKKVVDALVWRLPTSNEHREHLTELAATATSREDAAKRLSSLPRGRRNWLFRLISATVRAGAAPTAPERFVALAQAVGLDPDRTQAMLDE